MSTNTNTQASPDHSCLTALIDRYCKLLEVICVAALAVLVVRVFGNVVLRYVFDSGISVTEELSRWIFVWMVLLGAVVAMREHAHLGVDMVVQHLPHGGQVLMLYMCWLLLDGCISQAQINLHVTAASTGASVAIFYASGTVFAGSAFVILVRDCWHVLTGKLGDGCYIMITEFEEMQALQQEGLPTLDDGSAAGPRGGRA